MGRFITQDPSGMVDGPNLYLYCRNNPVNWVDVWGLCGEKIKQSLPPWVYIVGGITIATPILGDEAVFWAGVAATGTYTVLEFSRYNKKGPLWDAPGMQGWYQEQHRQSQMGEFVPPPNFKKGDWWKKVIWAIGKLAEAFYKD